jgi:hypothetical protein
MSRLDPDKLSVEYRDEVDVKEDIIPRRYTLTHSDKTEELFLTVGTRYAKDKITKVRDEILGEWIKKGDDYLFNIYLYIDGRAKAANAARRNEIFRNELPLALEAIRYGDSRFFKEYPELENDSVIVYFMSTYCQYHRVENWGSFSDYNLNIADDGD